MSLIKKKKKTNSGEDVVICEASYFAGKDVNWCSHFGAQSGSSSVNIELPYHPGFYSDI